MPDEDAYALWLVYPPGLRDWAPLVALRSWLRDELAHSQAMIAGLNGVATRHDAPRAGGGSGRSADRNLSGRPSAGRAPPVSVVATKSRARKPRG